MAKRRTPSQWQSLIEQQKQSGLSVPTFCTEHAISPASFYKWRQRFETSEPGPETKPEPSFIDLSALSSKVGNPIDADRPWHIVLSLGNGVELRLSQP
ncbi:MAG: IS66 family insertion sequence element accessory protein TnpA [Saccharospirillum sp.]